MKLLTVLCILGLSFAGPTFAPAPEVELTPTEDEVLKIIGGVFYGLGMDLVSSDIAPCLNDVVGIGDDLYQAVEDFKENDPSGMKNGIKQIGYALEGVPGAIGQCKKGVAPEIAELKSVLAIFRSPISFIYDIGKSLLLNGHEIFAEIKAAEAAWKVKNWWAFGENVGEALGKVFIS